MEYVDNAKELKERIDAIRNRCDSAMGGPWRSKKDLDNKDWHIIWSGEDLIFDIANILPHATMVEKNADFIAHAREDIPFLIQEIERLQAIIN